MIKQVDINCDMGELMPGVLRNIDEVFLPYISSCNISCGVHSGNPTIIKNTIKSAIEYNVSIGVHPSYPDRENAGRKSMNISSTDLAEEMSSQLHTIKKMVEDLGGQIYHVKPHGALYNDLAYDMEKATAFIETVKSIDPSWKIYGLANSPVKCLCESLGMDYISEVFADRRYEADLRLRSRAYDDAVLNLSEVEEQLHLFLHNKVKTNTGEIKDISTQSICIHSDTPDALEIAKKVHGYLKENNVEILKV